MSRKGNSSRSSGHPHHHLELLRQVCGLYFFFLPFKHLRSLKQCQRHVCARKKKIAISVRLKIE